MPPHRRTEPAPPGHAGRIGPDGSTWGSHSAFDGDEDMAMALLIACDNFGGADLCADAPSLIKRLALYDVDGTSAPKPGDNWGGCDDPR